MTPIAFDSVSKMVGKGQYSHSSRPTLTSQQSSSVPSTPHHRARQDFGTSSRSPSPRGLSGSHSPRSVLSEGAHNLSSLPKGRPSCKYESNMRLASKRRMQYDIGDAPLDDPKVTPKESLDPDEDKKISGDMRELYDRLLPTEDSDRRRQSFVEKLERILQKEWPEHQFTVHVFGSSGNMLCTSDSDVDICIQTPMKELETMHLLAAALDNNGMEKVVCVRAKVPIVKIWDPELKLAADLNVNNPLALENTRMIKTYVLIDERVRPLIMIIKHWTKQRMLNDAGIGGTLSSYAWICMIINFLQTRRPKIIPSLHQRQHKNHTASDRTDSGFDDDLEKLHKYGAQNKSSLGQLLFQFFRYYGYEFKYDKSVVSVRSGKVLTREEKGWQTGGKDGLWRLCVEEPFNYTRNLGNSVDDTAFRGIHLELRKAFTHLCTLDLKDVMEQYEFPPEEKEKDKHVFKRPQASKVVMSASSSRKNFGGGSMRSNRNNGGRGNHSGASSRRSSTGLMSRNLPPHLTSPMLPPEFFTESPSFQQWQQWQLLAQQQNQVQSMATAHAHSVLQSGNSAPLSREMSNSSSIHQNGRNYSLPGGQNGLMNGGQFYPNFFYGIPMDQSQPMSQSLSQDGSRTNPSSPSLGSSIPSRRDMRSSVSTGTSGASTRSQSQPARHQQINQQNHQNFVAPFPVGYEVNGLPLYPINNSGADMLQGFRAPENPLRFGTMPVPNLVSTEERFSRDGSSNAAQSIASRAGRVHSQPDLAQRNEILQNGLHPVVSNSSSKMSRSTSPGHSRQMSTPLRSAPLPSIPRFEQPPGMPDPNAGSYSQPTGYHPSTNGLLIVNGTDYPSTTAHEANRPYPLATPEEKPNSFFASTDSPASHYTPGPSSSGFYSAQDMDSLATRFAGGITLDSPNMGASYGPSDQAFPPFVEPSYASIAFQSPPDEQSIMSPTAAQHSPFQPLHAQGAPTNTSPAKDGQDGSRSPGPRSAPLLSPVMETRTPSPHVKRRSENLRPAVVNGNLVHGLSFGDVVARKIPEPVPPTPLPANTAAVNSQAVRVSPNQRNAQPTVVSSSVQNPWQTTDSKKKPGRKRARSGPGRTNNDASSSLIKSGQPFPIKPEERKGG